MNNRIPLYSEIKDLHFWVPPQPDSLMFILYTASGETINIDFLPVEDEETEDLVPGSVIPPQIFIDQELVELRPEELQEVLHILTSLINDNRLGHPEGLAVFTAKNMIAYYSAGKIEKH